jgi:[ribosomal protein S5]-alanine N-acetyltransferase
LAFGPLKLVRIQATARPENEGSNRTLTKNGFVPFGRSRKSFELAGTWYDLVYYERRADDGEIIGCTTGKPGPRPMPG